MMTEDYFVELQKVVFVQFKEVFLYLKGEGVSSETASKIASDVVKTTMDYAAVTEESN